MARAALTKDTFWSQALAGDDSLTGTDDADVLRGRGGNDTLLGLGGDDTLNGGVGLDTADYGDPGHSAGGVINLTLGTAIFGDETDRFISIENVIASQGDDTVVGDRGANLLWGEYGDDAMFGGRGADTLNGGGGDDVLQGGSGADYMNGGEDDDFVSGEGGNDDVNGTEGNDTVHGGGGNDRVAGESGNDVLVGGGGDDTLIGGAGRNGLDGGRGDDVFLFFQGRNYAATGAGADLVAAAETAKSFAQISDFDLDFDRIQLDAKGDDPLSFDDLIESGRLTISGDADHTVLTFGRTEINLLGVDVTAFDTDVIYVV